MSKRLIAVLPILFTLILFSAGDPSQRAQAQGPVRPRFEAFQLDIWPEYDHPDQSRTADSAPDPQALVIYLGRLPADTALPVEVTFRIPAEQGILNAVAVIPVDGGMPMNAAYDEWVEGDWRYITMTATMPEVLFEYYLPISIDGKARHFEYTWLGDFEIDWMVVQVQQPFGAEQVRIQPDFEDTFVGQNDNLTYFRTEAGSPGYGDTFKIKLDYQKDGFDLSKEHVMVRPTTPINQDESAGNQFAVLLPWIVGGVGVLLVAGGGLLYWRSQKAGTASVPAASSRGRRGGSGKKSPEQISADQNGNGDAVYCHQCGKRAGTGDRFCRTCGVQLRLK